MAVQEATRFTVADWIKLHDEQGRPRNKIINTMAKSLGLMRDALHFPATGAWQNTSTSVTARGSATVRAINQPVAATSDRFEQSVDNIMILTDFSVIDALLVDNAEGGPDAGAALRDRAVASKIQTMLELWETNIFRGDRDVNPLVCNGLQKRYSDAVTGANKNWIINGGGTTAGAQSSIYLVGWGEEAAGCPFARHLPMGTQHFNHGKSPEAHIDGETNKQLTVYKDEIQMLSGFTLGDYRYSGRICNLELTQLQGLSSLMAPSTTTHLLHLMLRLWGQTPKDTADVKYAWYGGREVGTALMRIAMEKSNAAVRIVEAATQFGQHVGDLEVFGKPFRISDVLTPTESVVAFS